MIEPIRVDVPKAGLQYRELTADEIQSVAHVFTSTGNPLPNPVNSTFVGAVRDGKVIGFLVLQAKLHAEPMWIENGESSIFGSLAKKAEEVILQRCGPCWTYLFAPAGRVSQLASAAGMQMEPWVIWSKLVMPEMPARGAVDLLTVSTPDEMESMYQEANAGTDEGLVVDWPIEAEGTVN